MKRFWLMVPVWGLMVAGCAQQQQPQAVQPAYVPAVVTAPPAKRINPGPDPAAALPAEVRSAYAQDPPPVIKQGITTFYPYDEHGQAAINCAILRVTEIVLAPGETVKAEDISIGDSERWAIKVSGNRIMVKPKLPDIATDIVAVTSMRSYHFLVRTRNPYQPQIAFYYPDEIRAAEAKYRDAVRAALVQSESPGGDGWSKPLNFNYTITGPNVVWHPVLAFDDGAHLYVEFPQNIAGTDMPTLMSQEGKQAQIVNYQVRGQYYIADRLLSSVVLSSGVGTNRQVVQINKIGGQAS